MRNKEYKKKREGLPNTFDNVKDHFDKLNKKLFDQYNENLSRNIKKNPKKFWSYVREQKTSKAFESRMIYKNKYGHNDSEISNLFAEFFSSVFCTEKNQAEIDNTLNDIDKHTQIEISEEEVRNAMKVFPLNKGVGVDGFPPIIIKECMLTLARPITTLFNKSLTCGILPYSLKSSHITPIFKKGEKLNIENYRSVAILPSLLKLFEKIMYDKIMSHFITVINDCQHGLCRVNL